MSVCDAKRLINKMSIKELERIEKCVNRRKLRIAKDAAKDFHKGQRVQWDSTYNDAGELRTYLGTVYGFNGIEEGRILVDADWTNKNDDWAGGLMEISPLKLLPITVS